MKAGIIMSYRSSNLLMIIIYAVMILATQFIQIQHWSIQIIYLSILLLNIISVAAILFAHFRVKKTTLYLTQNQTFQRKNWLFAVLGGVVAFAIQCPVNWVEKWLFQASDFSVNTNLLAQIIEKVPLYAIVIILLAPLMEEMLFRKIIYGTLEPLVKPIGAAVISSLLFGFVHFDGHMLIYCMIGFIFCWLYQYTKNIFTSYIAHVLMNTLVLINLFM